MSAEWSVVYLHEVATTKNGAGVKQAFFAHDGVPLARVTDFTDNSIDLADSVKVDRTHALKWESHYLRPGDVVVATVGSWPPNWSSVVGKTVFVPASSEGAIQNQNTCCIRAKAEKSVQRFLYYVLKTEEFIHYAANSASGSANQARLAVSKLEAFKFKLPPLTEQLAIAKILGSLDDRIALLRETNATLEAIAQALFKSWFVDFDPVHARVGAPLAGAQLSGAGRAQGSPLPDHLAALFPDSFEESELGMIPTGWRVEPIGDAAECVGGGTPNTKNAEFWEPEEFAWTTPKDLSGIKSPVLLQTERKLSTAGLAKVSSGLLPVGSLLMSSRAPIGYLAITQIPVAINQGYIAMLPGGRLPPIYLLFWCQQNMEVIKSHANGSTFMEISKKAFRPLPAIIPDESVISAFTDITAPLFARLVANEQQAQTLAQLRDTLLPKLISGQLRLPEAEALLAEETLP